MRVVVIGAGVGGLVLAHGLRTNGVEVAVYDRDAAASQTGGYRLHLDGEACAVLRRYLDPTVMQALLASSTRPAKLRQFTVTDHRLRILFAESRDTTERLLVGRVALRRLLTHGLDDCLHFGHDFTHAETMGDAVIAHFADGSTARGDVLVGADGSRSRVATQLAGRRCSHRTGLSGIAGRTTLTPALRRALPGLLERGPVLGFAPGGIGLFLTAFDNRDAAVAPRLCTAVPAVTEDPALIWGLLASDARFPGDAPAARSADLIEAATTMLNGWLPDVSHLVAEANRDSASFYRFHAADPDTELTPWPAGRITALGDAVHAMPPTAGKGASTAVRDAALLASELVDSGNDGATVGLAVHRYELGMAAYAAPSVRESLAPLRWQRRLDAPVGRNLARVAFPAIAAARKLRTAAKASPGSCGNG